MTEPESTWSITRLLCFSHSSFVIPGLISTVRNHIFLLILREPFGIFSVYKYTDYGHFGMNQKRTRPDPFLNNSPSARVDRHLRQWIHDGRLPPGNFLQSEEALRQQFGVSRTTVRKVLQQLEDDGLVEFRGKRRIVAAELEPNGDLFSETIALLGSSHHVTRGLGAPGWSHFTFSGVVDAVQDAGLHVLSLNSDKVKGKRIHRLLSQRPCGAILFQERFSDHEIRQLAQAFKRTDIPLVAHRDGESVAAIDTVVSDHEEGAYLLTRELIRAGCRRILRYWASEADNPDRSWWQRGRERGYVRALEEAGLSPLPLLEANHKGVYVKDQGTFDFNARQHAGILMPYFDGKQNVDAIMALSDGNLPTLAAGCKHLGIDPNTDVKLVGYDNYYADAPELAYYAFEPFATIDKNNTELGRELYALLADRVAGKLPEEPQHRKVKPTLILPGKHNEVAR